MKTLVLGATGFTGKLICDSLNSFNISFSAGGRCPKKLSEIFPNNKHEIIDIKEREELEALFANYDIIVNSIGPFTILSKEIATAAAKSGVIYLDVTGEQEFVNYCFKQLSHLAKKNNSLLINSCSFESLLADLMASIICEKKQKYKDISSFYHFENTRPSIGTRLTMKFSGNLTTFLLQDNKVIEATPLTINKDVSFESGSNYFSSASFMPYPEVLFIKKQYNVTNAGSYILLKKDNIDLLAISSQSSPKNSKQIIDDFYKRKYKNPSPESRKQQTFLLIVQAIKDNDDTTKLTLEGRSMYDLTGFIIASCVDILQKNDFNSQGVFTPAEIFKDTNLFNNILESEYIYSLQNS